MNKYTHADPADQAMQIPFPGHTCEAAAKECDTALAIQRRQCGLRKALHQRVHSQIEADVQLHAAGTASTKLTCVCQTATLARKQRGLMTDS